MKIITTSIYEQLAEVWLGKKRHIWVEGGTAASKTYSVLQLLILIAQNSKSKLLISIVSESLPHLRRGAVRDFFNILGESEDNNPKYNKSEHIYNFGNAKIEFFSADMPDKLRGARRDVLFLNEVNNISYDSFRELDSRTRLCTICDWNPVSEFFFHEKGLKNALGSYYIHATYKDALNVVPQEVIDNILAMGE